jgi:predicted RNA-binding Zn-ribbon protein involved in translation (DUF1610 family)
MIVKRDDVYVVHRLAIECLNCHEQIEFEERHIMKLICPNCGEELEFDE